MTKTDESTMLLRLVASSPAILGLFSPKGEHIFLYGSLPCCSHLSLSDTHTPLHLRHIFPSISETKSSWDETLSLVSAGGQVIQLSHRPREGGRVVIVLFPCAIDEGDKESAVGVIAVEVATVADELTARNRSLPATGRMLAIVGHELRNPLSAIAAGLGIIQMSTPTPPLENVVQMMRRQLELAMRLVSDLLDSTSVAANDGLPLVLKDELLSDVITATLDGFQHRVSAKKHTLSVNVPHVPIKIRCDLVRLAQAVTNLLHNASKYTPQGGHIELCVTAAVGEISIAVTDTGVGIAADKLEAIFEPFSQLGESAPQADGGIGLGLFLVKAIVEGHGGKVSVRSPGRNRGSVFEVVIPLNSAY